MTELQTNTRDQVVNTLQVFASDDRQIKYKNAVPFVHVPDEIVAQWDSYRELRNREWYIDIWDKLELVDLDNFDLKLKRLLEGIGEHRADVPEILENQNWIEIMEAADKCLRCVDRNCA